MDRPKVPFFGKSFKTASVFAMIDTSREFSVKLKMELLEGTMHASHHQDDR
jgi:hypothetical protein